MMENNSHLLQLKKLKINQRSSIQLCEISKIVYIECDSYISIINLNNSEKIKVSKLLKQFEQELQEQNFIRINRSILVNISYILKYTGGCIRELELKTGDKLTVSRRNVFKLKKYLSLS